MNQIHALRFFVSLFALCFSIAGTAADSAGYSIQLLSDHQLRFADVERGREVIKSRDLFVEQMTGYDRAVRMGKSGDPGREDYLEFAAQQVVPWPESDRQRLQEAIEPWKEELEAIRRWMPSFIDLILTTGKEEGEAAYTREGAIIFPQSYLKRSRSDLSRIFLHELFHIVSRAHPELREQLYEVVGFRRVGHVSLPDRYASRRLTNPDAPVIEHAIDVNFEGEDLTVQPVLYSSYLDLDKKEKPGLFEGLEFRLMAVEKGAGGWSPMLLDGEPRLLMPSELNGFFEQIGRNTGYIIHPEEILADNFVHMIQESEGLPNPEIPARMKEVFLAQ